ncbi:MAG: glycosyltransferase [Acidimicrobiia bacterium]
MSSSKPAVLLVTPSPLLPADSGGRIYTWELASQLADRFDYHLLVMCNKDERAQLDAGGSSLMDQYRSVFRSVTFVDRPLIPAELSRRRVLRHLWFHLRHKLPLMDVSYYSAEAVATAKRLIEQESIDLIEVDHLQMAFVKSLVPDAPAILVNHNIETDIYPFFRTDRWSRAAMAVWLAFGWFSRRNGEAIELKNRLGFEAKIFISPNDATRADESCPKTVVPLPIAARAHDRAFHADPFRMLWLGGFDWPPNSVGVRWLIEEVWPLVGDRLPQAELHIVGSNPPSDLGSADGRITFHGYQDDVAGWRDRADVLLAPLLTGSGVRVKIVEALAAGLPVVSTSKGCEGLAVTNGLDIVVADEPEAFADAVVGLANDPAARFRLSAGGVAYVAAQHSPTQVAAVKAEVMDKVLAR